MTESPTWGQKAPASSHKPMPGYAVVRPLSRPERLVSGLVLPGQQRTSDLGGHFYGKVLAVGPPGLTSKGVPIPPSVKPGDHVLVANGFGSTVECSDGLIAVVRIAEGERRVGIVCAWEPGDADLASEPLAPESHVEESPSPTAPEPTVGVELDDARIAALAARGRAGVVQGFAPEDPDVEAQWRDLERGR